MDMMWLLLLGIVVGRYALNILDGFLEWANHIINLEVVKVQVATKKEQMDFERQADKRDEPNRIGFDYSNYEDYYDDDGYYEEDEECKK